jgi:Acyl-CoA dehydrogenase, N-terminal domain
MPRTGTAHWIDRARELATAVFAPAATRVEASQRVPPEHLDRLAAEGFYGLSGPRAAGGLDVPFAAACQIIEILAGACLSTTFVWMQHHSVVRAVTETGNTALRQAMLGPLCRGERRAGVALAGLLPGPPRLRARLAEGGYVLDGTSPWVTGWGYIDTLYVAARAEDDTVVWAVLDAGGARTISTPTLTAQALGLAARCAGLIGPGPLDEQLARCRAALDMADPASMPAARAAACELALRTTAALVVSQGSSAIRADQDAQRLAREALFLLVFGSRPPIRQALAGLLTRPTD